MNWILLTVFLIVGCASNSNRNNLSVDGKNQANEPIPYDRHLCSYNNPVGTVTANAGHIKTCKNKNRNCYQAALYSERTGHFSEAQQFYKKACDQKNLDSCYCLAQSMMTDQKPESETAQVFSQSCLSGHQDSCSFIYKNLYFLHKDQSAFDRLQKDCDKGSMRACYFMGMIHQQNGDIKTAEKLNKMACAKKYSYACADLAQLFVSKEDYMSAEIYQTKACKFGLAESCIFLPPIKSESWIKPHIEFCKKGFYESCLIAMKSKNNSIVQNARKVACGFDTVICNRNEEFTKEEFAKKYTELKKNSLACVSDTSIQMSFKKKTQSFDISRCVK